MNATEWAEVVEWVADRFPDSQWHAEQAVAFFYDLEGFDASDVWAGVIKLYNEGRRFAPNGSELVAATRDERRAEALRDRYRGAPELPAGEMSWKEYTERRFGAHLSAEVVIRQLHAERTDCSSPVCDIHRKEVDDDVAAEEAVSE